MSSSDENGVNYDCPALLELTIEDVDFRLDGGKQGTALSISTRASGSWDWSFRGEARWDGDLRSKTFERRTLAILGKAFREALQNMD
ncbi:MAG TPA: hypothetical protein VHV51_15355 [Polyangiaceae bacterium]|jgi:hypothetical protein|nr:hypothetical protein [Polyangiaceae bacterium]